MKKKKELSIVEYVTSKLIRVPFPPIPEDEEEEVEDIAEIEEEEEQEESYDSEKEWNEAYENMLAKGEDLGRHNIDGAWTSWTSYWVLEKRADDEWVLWWMGAADDYGNTPSADEYGTYSTREKAVAAMENHIKGDDEFVG